MKCKDCKGTGWYQPLFGERENCQTCTLSAEQLKLAQEICEENDTVILKNIGVQPQVGDIIHVFDTDWYQTEVVKVYVKADTYDTMVRADYSCGTFRMPMRLVCWNDTDRRWEYIRSGTPVYP